MEARRAMRLLEAFAVVVAGGAAALFPSVLTALTVLSAAALAWFVFEWIRRRNRRTRRIVGPGPRWR